MPEPGSGQHTKRLPPRRESPAVAEPAPTATSVPATTVAPAPAGVPPRPVMPAGWTKSTNAALIARLLDEKLPLKDRRQAAHDLAAIGSDDAIAALKVALYDGPLVPSKPPSAKAWVKALAPKPGPSCSTWPTALMKSPPAGHCAAWPCAATPKPPKSSPNPSPTPTNPRASAPKPRWLWETWTAPKPSKPSPALPLKLPTNPFWAVSSKAWANGPLPRPKRSSAATSRLPSLPAENKAAALEALGKAQGEVAPFLLQYAADPDPQARAAAAWALVSIDSDTDLGPALTDLLKEETDPEVRLRLYQALASQSGSDPATLLSLAQKETDPAARLAGLDALARACRSDAPPEVVTYFNQTAVPELKNAALTGETSQDRLTAVMALGQADTAESRDALQQLAASPADHRVTEAAQAALVRR